jgi:hypothetical protein
MRNKRSRNHQFWKWTVAEIDASFIEPTEASGLSKPRPPLSPITAREDAESNARWARAQLSAKLRGPVSLGEIISLGVGAAAFSAFINYKQPGQDNGEHFTRNGNSQEPENSAAQRVAMPVQGHAPKDSTGINPTMEAGVKSDEGLQIARGSSFVPTILLRPNDDNGDLIPYMPLDHGFSPANRNWDVSLLGKAGLLLKAVANQNDVNQILNNVDIVVAAAEAVSLDQVGATPAQARTELPESTAPEAKTLREDVSELVRITTTLTDPNPFEAKQANRPWDLPADQVRPGPIAMKMEVDPTGWQTASASSQATDVASKEPHGPAQEMGGSEPGDKASGAQPKVWSSAAAGPTPASKGLDAAATTKGTIDQTGAPKAVAELKISNKQSDNAPEVATFNGTKFLATSNLPNKDTDAPRVVPEVDQAANPTVTPSTVPEILTLVKKSADQPGNITKPLEASDSIIELASAGYGPNAESLGQAGMLADVTVAPLLGKLHASTNHTKVLDSAANVEAVANQVELSHATHAELKNNHVMHDKIIMTDGAIGGTTTGKKDSQRQPDDHFGHTKPLNFQIAADPDVSNKAKSLLSTSDNAPFSEKTSVLEKVDVDQSGSPLDYSGASRIISQAEKSDAAPVQPKINQVQSSDSITQVGMGADTRATTTSAQNKLNGIVKLAKATDGADTEDLVGTEHAAASRAAMGTSSASSSKTPSQAGTPDSLGANPAQNIAKKDQDDATTPPGPGEAQLLHAATKVLNPTIQPDRFEFVGREIMSSLNDADHVAEAHATFPTLYQETTLSDWPTGSIPSTVDDRSIGTLVEGDHRSVSDADLVIL